MAQQKEQQIILITYEFTISPFSGNGILARSLVKSLLREGCYVTVWCCRPPTKPPLSKTKDDNNDKNGKDLPLCVPEITKNELERLTIVTNTISTMDKWHRLDDGSAWNEFTWDNLTKKDQSTLLKAVTNHQHNPKKTVILVVDWTGHHAWKTATTPISSFLSMASQSSSLASPPSSVASPSKLPLVYMNFRVFSSGVKDPKKQAWYDARESQAVHEASLTVCLSEKDKTSLLNMMMDHRNHITTTTTTTSGHTINKNDNYNCDKIRVLVPPLRGDMEDLALQHMKSGKPTEIFLDHMPPKALEALKQREMTMISNDNNIDINNKCFMTCVVRLSPEKNTRRFIRFLKKTLHFWKQKKWIPLLAGSSSDPKYAQIVKQELQDLCDDGTTTINCIILDSFLPPEAMVSVFSRTVFNFHPAAYDAYGMTIIEAAAFGVPSIIAAGNHVGASIHVGNGASIEIEMGQISSVDHDDISDEEASNSLKIMNDTIKLQQIGKEAQQRALAWDETAYAKALLEEINKHCY